MAIDDGLEKEKEKLNREWHELISERNEKVDAIYDRLDREGRLSYGLDGVKPSEVQAIDNEFRGKCNDLARRYRELERKERQKREQTS